MPIGKRWDELSEKEKQRVRETVPSRAPDFVRRGGNREEPEPVEVIAKRSLRKTDKAELFLLEDGTQQWVPFSLTAGRDEMDDGVIVFRVPQWWAEKNGLR